MVLLFFHFNTQSTRRSLELIQLVVSLKFISHNILHQKLYYIQLNYLNNIKLQLSYLVTIFKIFVRFPSSGEILPFFFIKSMTAISDYCIVNTTEPPVFFVRSF